jgi:hypothetical protein
MLLMLQYISWYVMLLVQCHRLRPFVFGIVGGTGGLLRLWRPSMRGRIGKARCRLRGRKGPGGAAHRSCRVLGSGGQIPTKTGLLLPDTAEMKQNTSANHLEGRRFRSRQKLLG